MWVNVDTNKDENAAAHISNCVPVFSRIPSI